MKAVVVVPLNAGEVILPPMAGADGYQLHYTGDEGQVQGGLLGCIGTVPGDVTTALVILDAAVDFFAVAESRGDLLFVEEVEDATP